MDRPSIEEFLIAAKMEKFEGEKGEEVFLLPNESRFIAQCMKHAESIAQYAIDKEREVELYKKAFEILSRLDDGCPPPPVQCQRSCTNCIKQYSLAEAKRQSKEVNGNE